jgi:hypothetical protein
MYIGPDTNQELIKLDRSTGDLIIDQSVLTVDSSTNRVGINDTTPLAPLHVRDSGENLRIEDTSSSGSPYMTFYQTTTRRAYIQFQDTDNALVLKSDFGPVRVKQSSEAYTGGFQIMRSATTNEWAIWVTSGNELYFSFDGNLEGYLVDGAGPTQMNFTGQHRTLSSDTNDNIQNLPKEELVGLIAVADGTYSNIDGGTEPTINESLPNVFLSEQALDNRVFGVISDQEDLSDGNRTYGPGKFVSVYPVSGSEPERLIINSVGEGAMWVCNYSGSLQNGDYITTSPITGLGMKQEDDILHSYTVSKITQDCDFNTSGSYIEFEFSGSMYRKQFVGVTYHCG